MSDADLDEPLYPSIALLAFRLAGQCYALPLSHIRQIADMVLITVLPDLPPPLEGIVDVHGRITAVIDMRKRLGLPAQPYQLHTPLVLVELGEQSLALAVDEVLGVREISSADLEVPDSFLPSSFGVRPRFVTSVGRTGGELVQLLDPSQLLLPGESEPLAAALRERA